MSEPLDWSARVLGLHLGLGDLQREPVCHGYANGCPCDECVAREEALPPVAPVQFPWETAA